MIIQMTGMSGAGKSTLAAQVKVDLEAVGYRVAVLDGDVYRQTLCSDLGYCRADRLENIKRLGRFAQAMAPDFDVVIIAAINPYEEGRMHLKEAYKAKLLFVDCALDILVQRDTKGLYKRALLDPQDPAYIPAFTGISDPFEQPTQADLVLDTGQLSVLECAANALEWLRHDLEKTDMDKSFQDFLAKLKEEAFLQGDRKDSSPEFLQKAKLFRGLFELNNQELYRFIFSEYRDAPHFEAWLRDRMGVMEFDRAKEDFLRIDLDNRLTAGGYVNQVLTADQLDAWHKEGYLLVPQVVDEGDCDRVSAEICVQLGVDLEDSLTWCPANPKWQGILLFSAKNEAEEAIRHNPTIKAVFEDLYRHKELMSMRAPLGYMPPIATGYPFRGSPLHWDMDMQIGPRYHIQGMVYLHDVAPEGGAFSLIPKMHLQFEDLIKQYGDMHQAAEALRSQQMELKIAGKKGDLLLWIETMPHAATPNNSDKPRFVQYITFEQLMLS